MTRRDPTSLLPLTPAMFYVLVALADRQTHGYAIMKEVERLTDSAVRLSTGTLYGIIKRLLAEGLIREGASRGADAARRRSYDLTPFGRTNENEVFVATDEPYGYITGTVARD